MLKTSVERILGGIAAVLICAGGSLAAEFRDQIRERLSDYITTQPISKPKPCIKRYFPKTYKLLFGP